MARQISLKLPLFDASNFEILKAFQPSKTLCKQSQLIQIIEEIRSPKINKSLHELQSLFKGEALMEASTLANLQVQQDNLLETGTPGGKTRWHRVWVSTWETSSMRGSHVTTCKILRLGGS